MRTSTSIIGCGDIGKRIAQHLIQQNIPVIALSHQKTSQQKLTELGIKTILANLDEPSSLTGLDFHQQHVYYLTPPQSSGGTDLRVRNFINSISISRPPQRIVYVSTTAVYGDNCGRWVTEDNLTSPQSDRGSRRLSAEQQIIQFCQQSGCEFNILRVSGIYCFSKLPINRLKAGVVALELSIAPSSNRIHADDLAHICITAMCNETSNQIFNVADGNPSSITDYFIQVAKVFDLPPPAQVSRAEAQSKLSGAMLSYLAESKKISIDKLINTLGVNLRYPDLTTGLEQCVAESQKQKATRV